jgi:hypothetical protein
MAARAVQEPATAAPRTDVYTGLLGIALAALVISCILLFLDYNEYGSTKATPPNIPPVAAPAGRTPAGQPAPAEPPPAPPAPM